MLHRTNAPPPQGLNLMCSAFGVEGGPETTVQRIEYYRLMCLICWCKRSPKKEAFKVQVYDLFLAGGETNPSPLRRQTALSEPISFGEASKLPRQIQSAQLYVGPRTHCKMEYTSRPRSDYIYLVCRQKIDREEHTRTHARTHTLTAGVNCGIPCHTPSASPPFR